MGKQTGPLVERSICIQGWEDLQPSPPATRLVTRGSVAIALYNDWQCEQIQCFNQKGPGLSHGPVSVPNTSLRPHRAITASVYIVLPAFPERGASRAIYEAGALSSACSRWGN